MFHLEWAAGSMRGVCLCLVACEDVVQSSWFVSSQTGMVRLHRAKLKNKFNGSDGMKLRAWKIMGEKHEFRLVPRITGMGRTRLRR